MLRGTQERCAEEYRFILVFLKKKAEMLFCKVKLFCDGRCVKTLVVSLSGVTGR